MTPLYGEYISKIKKIAPETASAETKRLLTAVALKGAKRPKLTKMTLSQRTSTTSRGSETELVACSYISQRVFPISIAILVAWLWSARFVLVPGESPWILS